MTFSKRLVCVLVSFCVCLSFFVYSVRPIKVKALSTTVTKIPHSSFIALNYGANFSKVPSSFPDSNYTPFIFYNENYDDTPGFYFGFKNNSNDKFVFKRGIDYTIDFTIMVNDTLKNYVTPNYFAVYLNNENVRFNGDMHSNNSNYKTYTFSFKFSNAFMPDHEVPISGFLDSLRFDFTFKSNFSKLVCGISDINVTYIDPDSDIIANENKNHEETKGWFATLTDNIKGWFDNLLKGFIDGLKNLFIPKDGFFDGFINEVNTFLTEHLGALYYPISVIFDVLNKIINFKPPDVPSIVLPGLSIPVNGVSYKLWDPITFKFDFINQSPFNGIHSLYLMAVDFMLIIGLINQLKKKMDGVMG